MYRIILKDDTRFGATWIGLCSTAVRRTRWKNLTIAVAPSNQLKSAQIFVSSIVRTYLRGLHSVEIKKCIADVSANDS